MQPEAHIDRMFHLGTAIAAELDRKPRRLADPDLAKEAYRHAMWFFFDKAYSSYQAAYLLCGDGFGEDALVLTRTLHELQLQAEYMSKDAQLRGLEFLGYSVAEQLQQLKRVKELCDPLLNALLGDHGEEARELEMLYNTGIETYAERLSQKTGTAEVPEDVGEAFLRRKHWWGDLTLVDLAKQMDKSEWAKEEGQADSTKRRTRECWYRTLYSYASSFVHTSPVSMMAYARGETTVSEEASARAKDNNLRLAAVGSTLFLLGIVQFVAEGLGLDIDDALTKVQGEFLAIVPATMGR